LFIETVSVLSSLECMTMQPAGASLLVTRRKVIGLEELACGHQSRPRSYVKTW